MDAPGFLRAVLPLRTEECAPCDVVEALLVAGSGQLRRLEPHILGFGRAHPSRAVREFDYGGYELGVLADPAVIHITPVRRQAVLKDRRAGPFRGIGRGRS